MKFFTNLFRMGLAAYTAAALIPATALAQPSRAQPAAQSQSRIALPPPEALIVMIRSSVVALGHANTTNNYTVLQQMGSANFRKENSPKKLSNSFAPFRSNKIDLAPVVFLTPQLTQQPRMENGRLRLKGFFPSRPMQVNFDLLFEPSEGIWKMYGIAVDLNRAPALAQAAQRPAAQQRFVPGIGARPTGR